MNERWPASEAAEIRSTAAVCSGVRSPAKTDEIGPRTEEGERAAGDLVHPEFLEARASLSSERYHTKMPFNNP